MKTTSEREIVVAKALNVTPRHVRRLVKEGSIDIAAGIPAIRRQMAANVKPRVGGLVARKARKGPKKARESSKLLKIIERKPREGPAKGTLAWTTLEREKVKLRKEELELRRSLGMLLEADEVRRRGFEDGRTIRDQVFNIADRLAMIMAAESDPSKIHAMLNEEFTRIFAAFADKTREEGAA